MFSIVGFGGLSYSVICQGSQSRIGHSSNDWEFEGMNCSSVDGKKEKTISLRDASFHPLKTF